MTSELEAALERHHWPGNVRELQNLVERMALLRTSHTLEVADLQPDTRSRAQRRLLVPGRITLPAEPFSLWDIEREIIAKALERYGGDRTHTARFLSIPRHTLLHRLEKYGLR